MANTGIKTVLTLRKYVDGVATSEVKINDPADPDYIAPYEDLVDCPVSGGVTPTTVAPTTATPTTQAQTTQAQTTQAQTTQAQTTQAQTTQAQTTQAQTTQAQTTQAQTTQAQLNPTCYEVTYDSSVHGLDQDRYGIAYVNYQGIFEKFSFNQMTSSVNGSELIYYVCADTVSEDVWDVIDEVAVPQYNDALASSTQGDPCDGACLPYTTEAPTTEAPTTQSQTTQSQTTLAPTTPSPTTTFTPAGTLLNAFCQGDDYTGEYADGNGGSYIQVIEANSALCTGTTTIPQSTTTTTIEPTTTVQATTTTTIDYTYYYAEPCGGGATVYFRSTTTMTFGEAIKIDAYGDNCYTVGTSGAPITSNEVTASYPDCEACNPSTTQTPTTIPSTTQPSGDCTTYLLENTSGIGTVGFSFTGCGPDLGTNAITVTNDGYETVCSSTVPTSSDPNAAVEALGDCGSVTTTIQPTTVAPVALTSFFTTSSAAVDKNSACSELVGTERWHDGNNEVPDIGNTVYLTNNSSGGTLGAGYWGAGTESGIWYQTDSNGQVVNSGPCGL